MTIPVHELETYRSAARAMARDAATMMTVPLDSEVMVKTDGSPVTAVDLAVNAMVIDTVSEAFPTHRVLGEEGDHLPATGSTPWCWVVDPVDGTRPFTMGLGVSTFSLALCHDGVPVVAAVADPWSRLTWTAVAGGGAWRNGVRCRVSDVRDLSGQYVFAGGHSGAGMLESLRGAGARTFDLQAGVRAGMVVADGLAAASVCGTLNHTWDVAAVDLIAREAGARTGLLAGGHPRFDEPSFGPWLTAAPGVWDEVAQMWADALSA